MISAKDFQDKYAAYPLGFTQQTMKDGLGKAINEISSGEFNVTSVEVTETASNADFTVKTLTIRFFEKLT